MRRECLLLLGLACADGPAITPDPDPSAEPTPAPTVEPRARASLRFKGGERVRNELSRVLGIPRDEVCMEVDYFDCVKRAHLMTLGGIEPYGRGLYEPVAETTALAPLAIDRMALHACITAVERRSGPFYSLEPDPVITSLYNEGLLRQPTQAEREAITALMADASPTDAAVLACFTVLTSTEALFY